MEQQKKEELFSQIDFLIGIFEKNNPVSKDKKFSIEAVKQTIDEMIAYIVKNADEAGALRNWMNEHDFWKTPASSPCDK